MLQTQLQAALTARDEAQVEVDRLAGPATEARDRLSEADTEARKLARLADEAQSTANRSNEPADRQAAHLAERAAERAADRRAELSAVNEQTHGALNAARSALSLAQVHVSKLDQRVNADQRAADARQAAEDAAAALTIASDRIATLSADIEREQANLEAAIERKDIAVTAGDRDQFLNSEFDAQVAARAIETAKAELSQIDLKALRADASDARVRADRLEHSARIEAFSRSIDWSLMPGSTVTLRKHDQSVTVR